MDKKFKKLKKAELLELLIELSEENDYLKIENSELKKQLEDKTIMLNDCGSIAEASLKICEVFKAAQQAADCYLENVKRNTKNSEAQSE